MPSGDVGLEIVEHDPRLFTGRFVPPRDENLIGNDHWLAFDD
jgi:hypothetical protein